MKTNVKIIIAVFLVFSSVHIYGLGSEEHNLNWDSLLIEDVISKGENWEGVNVDSSILCYKKAIVLLQKSKRSSIDTHTVKALNEKERELLKQRAVIYLFVSITLMTIILIILGYFSYTSRTKKERHRLEKELLLYRQKAVNQQMNPHFIFNTLNSIQYFVINNDKVSASKYISKFSQLMRITLDNSQNSLISLQTEIDALQLYVQLEQVRFKNKFEYQFEIESKIEPEIISIPPLIIQPYVENAIWHGLMHIENEKQGILSIRFLLENNLLVCRVEDNGIGRENALRIKEQKASKYKSLGMSITESRISIINQIYKSQIMVIYNDLFDHNKNSAGTVVTVSFPVFSKIQ